MGRAARELPFSDAFIGVVIALVAVLFSSLANIMVKMVRCVPAASPAAVRNAGLAHA